MALFLHPLRIALMRDIFGRPRPLPGTSLYNIYSFLQIPNFAAKVASRETHHDVGQLHMIDFPLRIIERTLQCDAVRLPLVGLLVLLEIPPIFCSFWELFLPIETLILLDVVWKLRQLVSENEPIFVDVENLFSVFLGRIMILDIAFLVCHRRPLHKLNFEFSTPVADSAVDPRRHVPVSAVGIFSSSSSSPASFM